MMGTSRRILGPVMVVPVILMALLLPVPRIVAQSPVVTPGIDTLLGDVGMLRGKRIGLVTHQAGLTADGRTTAAALASDPGVRLTALFAPEHGIDGTYDAGEFVPTIPGRTPIYSLHGETFQPTREMLARVDVLVVDLQDVGVRPYTYTSTMASVMAAAHEAGKPVVILDRPNPLGGLTMDGPVLEPELRSFIGPYPIPYVFGMTIGELAQLYNQAFGIGAKLTVVPMRGWTRSMLWADTGLPWQNPSPGITSPEAVFHYAATGPVDGTNLWNGVATESRFQVVLAPWIDGPTLAGRLNKYGLPGVQFTPSALPHPRTGKIWYGVRLHITDPARFQPSTTIVYVLAEIRRLYGTQMVFTRPRRGPYLFDMVWGTKTLRLALSRGDAASAIAARWQPALQRFQTLREPHLLYK
jgi:uncharacterized protein YbbC (DUF1343 family)